MLNFPALSMEEYLTRRGWQPRSERGGVLYGPCPIHDGDDPNFVIYPDHFYCYKCEEQGDIIKLVQLLEFPGLDSPKQWAPVYKRVKELSGIHPDDHRTRRPMAPIVVKQHPVATQEQCQIMTAAMAWWHECLHSLDGLDGYNWLTEVGVEPDPRFPGVIGYAPRMTSSLIHSFARWMENHVGEHWTPTAKETGILLPEGKHRNQSRVMFGCVNDEEQIVFYQGRTILAESPNTTFKRAKYLGPPCMRKMAFWVPLSRPSATSGTCLVEGPKSVSVLSRYDIPSAAVLGSGVTAEMLGEFTSPFWVLTDNDPEEIDRRSGEVKPGPGEKLAQRIIAICEEKGWPYQRILVPFQHNSPDVWVREEGPLPLLEVVAASGKTGVTIASKSHQNVVDLPVEVR